MPDHVEQCSDQSETPPKAERQRDDPGVFDRRIGQQAFEVALHEHEAGCNDDRRDAESEQQLASQVKDVATEKGRPVAQQLSQAGQEAAQELRDSAQQRAQSVKETATDAASTVRDEAQSQASDVTDHAQDARGRVTDQAGSGGN